MKRIVLVVAFVLPTILMPASAQNVKPTVSVDSNYPAIGSGAANAFRKQAGRLTQYLQTDCGLRVTIKADKADYLVIRLENPWPV